MCSIEEPAVQAIARLIEQYLAAHVGAADSLKGICIWWLPGEEHGADPETVKRALDGLVNGGLVEEVQLVDGTTIYRRR
jgi:Fe2+ or Zn2+ uptake regulation protein